MIRSGYLNVQETIFNNKEGESLDWKNHNREFSNGNMWDVIK